MLCGQKKNNKKQPEVSEKDSNWFSSGYMLFLVNRPENTARDWSSLNSCLPVCFFFVEGKGQDAINGHLVSTSGG